MPLTPAALAHWTRRILHTLTPALLNPALAPSAVLPPATLEALHGFFRDLADTPVTAALLRRTRAHRALLAMAEPGGGWPAGLAARAEAVLARWADAVAAVERRGLWAPGGRMAGCVAVRGVEDEAELLSAAGLEGVGGAERREWWAVEGARRERSRSVGHAGFHVGEYASLPLYSPHPVAHCVSKSCRVDALTRSTAGGSTPSPPTATASSATRARASPPTTSARTPSSRRHLHPPPRPPETAIATWS